MSSYSSPAPQGDSKATGAYAVAIAAQAGGTNNDGHATDSAGNVVVDFAWGNFPLQPNDVRRASVSNFGGGSAAAVGVASGLMHTVPGEAGADTGWAATTQVASTNLAYGDVTVNLNNGITSNVHMDNHVRAESAYAGYPLYTTSHQAVYRITQASGSGSVQTYTAPNNLLKAGDTVNITGTGLDGTNLTVASANQYTFTVAGSGTGSYINISGTARYTDETTSNDGAYVAGVDYVLVPSVLGFATASATDAMNDAELVPTTASAATNSPITVTAVSRTLGNATATITATGAGAAFPVGTSITISGLTNNDAEFDGSWIVTGSATNTVSFVSNGTSSVTDTGLSGSVKGTTGTIKTQSVAAGTASITAGTAVTITPWA